MVYDVLNCGCDDEARHEELGEFLATRAERDVNRQLDAAEAHVEHETLRRDRGCKDDWFYLIGRTSNTAALR
ncbi:hypothetical protein C8039_20070 [Halogeometricum sp. wsp3]|nr:hypothetical protein C8039_20070 [Halogeometricum sp. wsp3]